MKTRKTDLVLFVGILFVAFCARANVTNRVTDPFGDDFEAIAENATIIGTNGWYADVSKVIAKVVTADVEGSYGGILPLTNSLHTRVLSLEAGSSVLTNLFSAQMDVNAWIDTMVQMNPADAPPASITNDNTIQFAAYLNTSSNLVVYHSENYIDVSPPNIYSVITNVTIADGEWFRLTMYLGFTNDVDGFSPTKFFQVMINGLLCTNDHAFSEPNSDDWGFGATLTGSWFVCANRPTAYSNNLKSVNLSGAGLFDDFVVTDFDPYGPEPYRITVIATNGGTILPGYSIRVASGNPGPAWSISSSNGYFIAKLIQSGANLPPTNSYQIASVTSNIDFSAQFLANSTTLSNGIPEEYMQKVMNIFISDYTNAAATDDYDGDGYLTANEFLFSSDPTDPESIPRIIASGFNGSTPYVKWVTDYTNAYPLPPFAVMRNTNFLAGAGWTWYTNVARTQGSSYTNTWIPPTPTKAYFYRIAATNAP